MIESSSPSMRSLWRQFLPLSVSDVTMAAGDPLITTALARLPDSTGNLAAVGVAKAVAVFFESPVIMLLHASNALAPTLASRRALRRFMLLCCALLTILLSILVTPPVFDLIARNVLGLSADLVPLTRSALMFLILWPAAIGWRRYYQGLLIRHGAARAIAHAGFARLAIVVVVLVGCTAFGWTGVEVAGSALIIGVVGEAVIVTVIAHRSGATADPIVAESKELPNDLRGVWRFYWPLANSMLVAWGGRAMLIAVLARSVDSAIALAAWPAAWGLTLVIANATRMVQQVVIKNRGLASDRLLYAFGFSVGGAFTAILLFIAMTPMGIAVIDAFVGNSRELSRGVQTVILFCSIVPMLIAVQNTCQGILIGEQRTRRINVATWIGTATLLIIASFGVAAGQSGTVVAATAMVTALLAETAFLLSQAKKTKLVGVSMSSRAAARS